MAWRSRGAALLVVLPALPVVATGCGGKLNVAEDRDPSTVEGGTADARAPAPDATTEPSPVEAGTPYVYVEHNDPCNAVGLIEVFAQSPRFEVADSAKAIVVAFDPPRVLGSARLSRTELDDWIGEIDPRSLDGSPDCVFLRSAAVFQTFEYPDHTVVSIDGINEGFSGNTTPCDSLFTVETGRAERLRVFGMKPDGSVVDGPVAFEPGSLDGTSSVYIDADDFPACTTQDYVYMLVGHRGDELVHFTAFTLEGW